MRDLNISKEAWFAVNSSLIAIDEIVGSDIAVTIILHDQQGRMYTVTDGPPGDLQIKFVGPPAND